MTAAQLLVALSGLVAGTAAQHLQAITAGNGPGTTIYCSQISLLVEQLELDITCEPPGRVSPITSKNDLTAFQERTSIAVFNDGPEKLTVLLRKSQVVSMQSLEDVTATHNPKARSVITSPH